MGNVGREGDARQPGESARMVAHVHEADRRRTLAGCANSLEGAR